MLIKDLLPSTVEGALSVVSDIGNKDFLCDWMPGSEIWRECPHCNNSPQGECSKLVATIEKNNDDSCSLIVPSSSEVSTSTIMSGSSTPLCVYHRKKVHRKSLAIYPGQTPVNNKLGDGCDSAISSEAHSGARKEHLVSVESETEGARYSLALPAKCSAEGLVSNSGSYNGCLDDEPCSEEGLRTDTGRTVDVCCIDDSCSSSKLNLDLVSAPLKTDDDDTGECSSSSALFPEGLWENMSERDICISILRSQGLLEIAAPLQDQVPTNDHAMASDHNCCSRTCNVCGRTETTLKMLICDHCEDAFHASCCNPRIKRIPLDEWFCYSCLKKKHKILKETSPSINNESTRCRNATIRGEVGPIALMLRDIEPLKFNVRVGHEYQIEVPNWSGPVIDEIDPIGEPEEIRELEYLSKHANNSNKAPRFSSIGNWVQCCEVIEGVGEGIDGSICGKWRRPPLFEVQTDDWECFDAVLWDPAHADCAVPQELPTDEVLKHLKYIEMLRPRLAAKKRKLEKIQTGS